ncbi:hypothetical protein GCM10027596_16740 [Nocardioides korecus]
MTVIAVTAPPTIVCPPWCNITQSEHLADLPNWDGMVVHWSADLPAGEARSVRIASTTFPDGTPDPAEPMSLFLDDSGLPDGAPLEAAQQHAEGILAALKVARA